MIAKPKRIQRKRIKGWRMPDGAVYVGRSSRWGNPFNWQYYSIANRDPAKAKALAVLEFRVWMEGEHGDTEDRRRREILDHIHELRGKDLACWCKPSDPCHADVLIEMANKTD